MKWKLNTNTSEPNEGDLRTVRKFAWFPVLVKDGDDEWYHAWLETYMQVQEYKWAGDGFYMWKPIKNIALFWAD